jgi:predicted nuclease of predicted toxin-antitoxin system
MKLLFDQNISFRVLPLIKDLFPEADQIHQLGFKDKTDMKYGIMPKKTTTLL